MARMEATNHTVGIIHRAVDTVAQSFIAALEAVLAGIPSGRG